MSGDTHRVPTKAVRTDTTDWDLISDTSKEWCDDENDNIEMRWTVSHVEKPEN